MNKPRLWNILEKNGKFDLVVYFDAKYLHNSCNLELSVPAILTKYYRKQWDLLVFPKFERDKRITSFSPDCAMHCDSVWRTVDIGSMVGGCIEIWQIWCDHL